MAVDDGRRLLLVNLDVLDLKKITKNPMLKRYLHSYDFLEFNNGSPSFYKKLIKSLPKNQNMEAVTKV